jgi:hypothetical protein
VAECTGRSLPLPRCPLVPRFAPDLAAAFANLTERMGAGEDAPPEHPLLEAVRNPDDPEWVRSAYAVSDPVEWARPVEDLSE